MIWGNQTAAPDDHNASDVTHGQIVAFRDHLSQAASEEDQAEYDTIRNITVDSASDWIIARTPKHFQVSVSGCAVKPITHGSGRKWLPPITRGASRGMRLSSRRTTLTIESGQTPWKYSEWFTSYSAYIELKNLHEDYRTRRPQSSIVSTATVKRQRLVSSYTRLAVIIDSCCSVLTSTVEANTRRTTQCTQHSRKQLARQVLAGLVKETRQLLPV